MLKKIVKHFYLPSPLAISIVLFLASLVFAFSFTNPRWGSNLSDTAPSHMAYGAVVPFLFAASLIMDCFVYFEKDMKEKPRRIFSLCVGGFEFVALLVSFILYLSFSPERVIPQVFYPFMILSYALALYGIYIRVIERKRKELIDLETETFVAMMAGCFLLGFMPLLNAFIYRDSLYTSMSMAAAISFIYIFYGLIATSFSLCLLYIPKLQKIKFNSMSVLSAGALGIGVVGIVLATIYHNGGQGFPIETCYWVIAAGFVYFIIGVGAFFYTELRKANSLPVREGEEKEE